VLAPVPLNKPSAADVADRQAVQDSVTLSEQLDLNRFDPDYYPLQLGNNVLGGGFYATRLYHDLRQVAGYVYTVDVGLRATESRSTYTVDYGCNPENVSKARALIQRDLEQMRTQDVSPAELQQAKALLLRQIPLGESSEEAVAGGILGRAIIGLPLRRADPCSKALRGTECRSGEGRVLKIRASRRLCSGGSRPCSADWCCSEDRLD
jgi:zinc protease